jgi:chromatin segregation and condensation protein Rec8/ScpA/Scc1 (kleisin family)
MRSLARALKNRFKMSKEDARKLADIVNGIFKGKKEIEDADMDKYVRALFYELERERLLRVRREEYKQKGRLLRKYYWSIDRERVKKEAEREEEEDPGKIYRELARKVWLSRTHYNT